MRILLLLEMRPPKLGGCISRAGVPDLSRYAPAPSTHGGLVSRQRSGSTSVSLCDLVWLGADESDPPARTENPRGCFRTPFIQAQYHSRDLGPRSLS